MSESLIQSPRQKIQNLSFQLILINFAASKSIIKQGGGLKFSIIRGKQVFEETKNIPISATTEGVIPLNRARLNFMVFSYDPAKVYQFGLKIQHNLMGEQKCIGECFIDCNSYAQIFLSNGNGAFQETLYLNPQQKIEVELYVGKNRFSLEKLVRQITSPKTKSTMLEEIPAYQRITDKKIKFSQQLSLSPQRSRQNPYKRNSPRKNREQITTTPKKREQFAKEPEIHIQPHYSIVSNKQQAVIQQPLQQQIVENIEQYQQQEETKIVKIDANCEVITNKPYIVHEEAVVKVQQPQIAVQVIATVSNEEIPQKIEQVPANIKEPQIVVQPMVAVAQQIQVPKSQFKLQNAADLLKEQFVSIPSDLKPQQNAINNTLEETDKPTLHSINDETTKDLQIQEIKQVKIQLKQPIQTLKLEGSKEVVDYIVKRASIFKTMSVRLKILLALLLLAFLIASNYVQEKDGIQKISEIEVPTVNKDQITPTNQHKIPKKKPKNKNTKQSMKDEKKSTPKSNKQKIETKKQMKEKVVNQRQKRKEK